MENASKALIMAGSVLIGIIVISLFMIMYNSLTDYQQTQTQMKHHTNHKHKQPNKPIKHHQI